MEKAQKKAERSEALVEIDVLPNEEIIEGLAGDFSLESEVRLKVFNEIIFSLSIKKN